MILTQKNFDVLCDYMNHKITMIEGDVKWIKRVGYYLVGVVTATAIGVTI